MRVVKWLLYSGIGSNTSFMHKYFDPHPGSYRRRAGKPYRISGHRVKVCKNLAVRPVEFLQ